MTRLPSGSEIPVPLGSTSAPCPGAHTLRKGVLKKAASDASRSDGAPKHVHPLPAVAALAAMAWAVMDGGTRESTAWWTSGLPGRNWLEMTYEFFVMCGLTKLQ